MKRKLPSLKAIREKLSSHSELRQRKALWDILKFFIFMLLCTFVAKSASGATMAVVETSGPTQALISQDVTINGTVSADDPTCIELPAGIHIEKTLVQAGDSVSPDTPVLQLNMDDLKEALQKQKILCSQTQLDINSLRAGTPADGGSLVSLRNTLDWASQDYQTALQKLNEASAVTEQALQRVQELEAQPAPDPAQLEEARRQLADAQTAQAQALSAAESAERSRQNAQASYASAEASAKAAQQQAETQKQKNELSAQLMELELADQIAVRRQLTQIISQEGIVNAGAEGVLLSIQDQGSVTTSDSTFKLSMTGAACSLESEVNRTLADAMPNGTKIQLSDGKKTFDAVLSNRYPGATDSTVRLRFTFSAKSNPQPDAQMWGSLTINKKNYPACVPLTALHTDQNGTYILVVEEKNTVLGLQNELVRVSVSVDARNDMVAAISSSALKYDSKIVISSTRPVKSGDRVRLA